MTIVTESPFRIVLNYIYLHVCELQARLEALSVLIQTPSFDTQSCDSWPAIRQGLLDALADPEEKMWVCSMYLTKITFVGM